MTPDDGTILRVLMGDDLHLKLPEGVNDDIGDALVRVINQDLAERGPNKVQVDATAVGRDSITSTLHAIVRGCERIQGAHGELTVLVPMDGELQGHLRVRGIHFEPR